MSHFRVLILLSLSALPMFLLGGCNQKDSPEGDLSTNSKQVTWQKGDLSKAVFLNDEDRIIELLEAGAPVQENLGSEDAMVTPLMIALFLNRDNYIVEKLIFHGASAADSFLGYTAIDVALLHENSVSQALMRSSLK